MQDAKTPATHFFMIALPVQTATLILVARKSFHEHSNMQLTCHKAEFELSLKRT